MSEKNSDAQDIAFMKRALMLAEKGRGSVSPNPMVGAVIVKDGDIVGEGYHQKFGKAHAEVNAIADAGDNTLGSTMYVTMEPCNHTGKTGPCTEKIFEAGISKVVIGMVDPNPLVNRSGINYLRSKGIKVVENVLAERVQELNKPYAKYITTGLPYILLKMAQTLDGRIASSTGHSKWVTDEESRAIAHKMRARHDAILVGIGTVLMDDPHLTVRMAKGLSPKRIVLDSQLRIPLDANVLSDESLNKTIIVTTNVASKEKIGRIVDRGSTVLVLDANDDGWVPQDLLWKELGELGITSIMVEGGNSIHTECLKGGYADEIVMFIAPKLLGTGVDSIGDLGVTNMNAALELENIKIKKLKKDFMITADLNKESKVQ